MIPVMFLSKGAPNPIYPEGFPLWAGHFVNEQIARILLLTQKMAKFAFSDGLDGQLYQSAMIYAWQLGPIAFPALEATRALALDPVTRTLWLDNRIITKGDAQTIVTVTVNSDSNIANVWSGSVSQTYMETFPGASLVASAGSLTRFRMFTALNANRAGTPGSGLNTAAAGNEELFVMRISKYSLL